MKIRKIEFENHTVFGNLKVDFTDSDGKTINTIILAGENGVGKSLLLNTVYNLSTLLTDTNLRNEIIKIEVELPENVVRKMRHRDISNLYFVQELTYDKFVIYIDFNKSGWEQIYMKGITGYDHSPIIPYDFLQQAGIKQAFNMIFSDVEINFIPSYINSVTSSNIDDEHIESRKSTSNLSVEIAQLLVDVQSLDALELNEWVRDNMGKPPEEDKIDVRMKRFTKAFEYMFSQKKYKKIKSIRGYKDIIFEENGKEMSINDLSSGEKQIVFRGSFLLKNKESNKGAVVLIDEPELTLHPNWQLKILSFFKKLFTNEDGDQTSQIIISTHSTFIIHNANRDNDKVIILHKDSDGRIYIPDEAKFYGWTNEMLIREAFNINQFLKENITTVFLEGETDEKYFRKCCEIFNKQDIKIEFDWIGRINESGHAEHTGNTALNNVKAHLTANSSQIHGKVVLFYDIDCNKPEENIGSLYVRQMTMNKNNLTFTKGIENLLILIEKLELSIFYNEKTIKDGYSNETTTKKLDKMKLCDFICNSMDIEDQKIIFGNIAKEIDMLIEI